MTYRRDTQANEQIPLPIETVYNSISDAVTTKIDNDREVYFQDSNKDFNQIYFKYPHEWRTSDVGEKIIGIRNMKINVRKNIRLDFVLYIRKYDIAKFNKISCEILDEYLISCGHYDHIGSYTEQEIQSVIDRMEPEDCKVFVIEYHNDIFDNIDDFIKDLERKIDEVSLYNKLRTDILKSKKNDDETDEEFNTRKINALEQLNKDKNDYDLMCLHNNVSFHLNREHDMRIYEDIGKEVMLKIEPYDNYDLTDKTHKYHIDFMMTTDDGHHTYGLSYMVNEENDEPTPYASPFQYDLDNYMRFEFDTACYFHLGDGNPFRNNVRDLFKYRHEIIFKHMMTNVQCEVAASFASQSNRNLIGRTNEAYTPIKYYKINDNDDKFWIKLYDRNENNIPVAFEDFIVFTMDVVLLQNRKLLYS